jgi:hypothetical protein
MCIIIGVISRILYLGETSYKNVVEGYIEASPGERYYLKMEVLMSDIGEVHEKVESVTINGQSMGECNPRGGDYECIFFKCPAEMEVTVPRDGKVNIKAKYVGNSHDCNCNLTTLQCSDERSSRPGHTFPVRAMVRFTMTPKDLGEKLDLTELQNEASQSKTEGGNYGGSANQAIDGNRNGNFAADSCSYAKTEPTSW